MNRLFKIILMAFVVAMAFLAALFSSAGVLADGSIYMPLVWSNQPPCGATNLVVYSSTTSCNGPWIRRNDYVWTNSEIILHRTPGATAEFYRVEIMP